MKTIYTALIARLGEKVSALKWIALDTGQLDAPVRASVRFPAALLGIEIPQCRSLTDRRQQCRARITVHIAFSSMPDRTAAAAPEEVRTASLNVYDVIASVYAALQGYETDNFNALQRVSQGRADRRDGMFVYRIVFDCEFEDVTAED